MHSALVVGADVYDASYALCERTPAAAARFLAHLPPEQVSEDRIKYPRSYWEGVVARGGGDGHRND